MPVPPVPQAPIGGRLSAQARRITLILIATPTTTVRVSTMLQVAPPRAVTCRAVAVTLAVAPDLLALVVRRTQERTAWIVATVR